MSWYRRHTARESIAEACPRRAAGGDAWHRPVRLARSIAAFLLLCAHVPPAHAALRVPQVPVSGTALQSFFNAQGQTLNVGTQQLDLQRLGVPADQAFQVNSFGVEAASFGAYNASAAVPSLYQLFAGAASPGWFAVASFRNSPVRLVVNIFDAVGSFQGTTTYLGADHTDFGFYVQGAGGTFYSQDVRNPGAAAKILAYGGTGPRAGSTWFACETSAGSGGDFADLIMLVDLALAPVPVLDTSWDRVKRLFR